MSENKSVDRILRILELLSKNPKGLTLSEIYKDLALPKSTVFDILQALYKADAVYYKDEKNKRYVIGSKIYAFGQTYTKNSSLINVCKPFCKALGTKYGNLLYVTKRVNNNIVYVHKYESDESNIATFEIGGSISFYHSNSVGKCYLAFDNYFANYDVGELKLITPYTIVNKVELDSNLKHGRSLGYTAEYQEDELGMKSVSFPIYNFENRCCGALTFKSPYSYNFTNELINDLLDAARNISSKLGYKR